MIITHKELIQRFTRRQIDSKLKNNELYKIEKGYYSTDKNYDSLELLIKKHPNAIFNSESAFYFWGLTDEIPDKEYVATERKAKPIKDDNIVQTYSTIDYYDIGKTTMDYSKNVKLNIYDKERMLIELARNRNTWDYDYYKEIISNYRNIVDELDMQKLSKYLKKFKNSDNIYNTIHKEVF